MSCFRPYSRVSWLLGILIVGGGCGAEESTGTPTPAAGIPTATASPSPTATAVPTPTPTAVPPGEGTLAVTFRIDPDWMAAMSEPAIGRFWGDVFLGSEVTNLGPNEGAEALASIYVESVDLTPDGGPTAVLFVTDPLPNTEVVILGFLDSDGNADPEYPGPDKRDPVTFPADNRFDVITGQQTQVEVFFGLLNP